MRRFELGMVRRAVSVSLVCVLMLLFGVEAAPREAAARLGAWPALPAFERPAPQAASSKVRVVGLAPRDQLEIERLVDAAISRGEMPGAVIEIGRRDRILFRRAFGLSSVEPVRAPLVPDAVFDLASVTKAVATATSIAKLVELGKLAYDAPASRYVPAFALPDKRAITLRQLLTHTSGLPADNAVDSAKAGLDGALASIAALPLVAPPGERYLYSDLGFIVLGAVVARASGQSLDTFATRELFAPLGLASTSFRPGPELAARAVPTERVDGVFLRGTVHDPRARALGGVAGHAGLFSSADDLGRFARMLLGGGALDGTRVLSATTVRAMTAPVSFDSARVALGWDSPDEPAQAVFSAASFGHEGFTGTSFWVDPTRDLFVVFLSSRLHPDGKGRVAPVAQAIRAVAAGAVEEQRDVSVELGIDRLEHEGFARLAGKRVALVTNGAARDREGRRTLDVLFAAPKLTLVKVLTPEHGLGGDGEGSIEDGTDPRTGLPVLSLYAPRARPTRDLVEDVDVVVVDLVDVGVRFYTYAATLLDVLGAAATAKKPVLLLDRPNPLGGAIVEGPVSDPGPLSLVNPFPLPTRHGLTQGELARLFTSPLHPEEQLEVVPVRGWRRSERFDATGLDWFAPSPNLRSARAALLYPGLALVEATNLSVGRGTATPFELVGAPWVRSRELARRIDAHALPGVRVRPVDFVPDREPHRGVVCHGLRFEVTDAERFRAVALGLALIEELRALHASEWQTTGLGTLLGSRGTTERLAAGAHSADVLASFEPDLASFRQRRSAFLLYR